MSKNTIVLDRETAYSLPLPQPQGPRHRPLNYGVVIDTVEDKLREQGYTINRSRYELSRPRDNLVGTCMTGTLDIDHGREIRGESGLMLGVLHDNMRRASFRMPAGRTVFVCDNLLIHGDDIVLDKRHTEGLETRFPELVARGIREFTTRQAGIDSYIEQLQHEPITDTEAEGILYRLHAQAGLPCQYLKGINRNYFRPDQGTADCERGNLWGLHNACTRELRGLPLHRRVHYTKLIDAHINMS